MEKKYSFAIERLYGDLSAETASKELDRITAVYGELKPEYVVKESKEEDAVLHNCFDWDDSSAAEKYRNEQARMLIKNIRVEIVHENVNCKVRAFVNVRPQKELLRTYVPVERAILDDQMYKDLLEQAKNDMQSFVDTYSQITELNAVKAEMLKVLNEK